MAKKKKSKREWITLYHKDENGNITHSYHSQKNKMNTPDKLILKKYNPVLRIHTEYKEK
jgi:ribosomal protein L33